MASVGIAEEGNQGLLMTFEILLKGDDWYVGSLGPYVYGGGGVGDSCKSLVDPYSCDSWNSVSGMTASPLQQ